MFERFFKYERCRQGDVSIMARLSGIRMLDQNGGWLSTIVLSSTIKDYSCKELDIHTNLFEPLFSVYRQYVNPLDQQKYGILRLRPKRESKRMSEALANPKLPTSNLAHPISLRKIRRQTANLRTSPAHWWPKYMNKL